MNKPIVILLVFLSITAWGQNKNPKILSKIADLATHPNPEAITWAALYDEVFTSFPAELLKCKNLEHITFAKSSFTDFPVEMIKSFPKLKWFDMTGCGFTEVPSILYQLPNLTSVSLRDNKLTLITEDINKLKKIERLDLSGNQIESVTSAISLPKINSFDLSKNKLKTIPDEIYSLKTLENLYLADNPITEVSPLAGELHKIENFVLTGTQIQSLPATFKNCGKLQQVVIINTPMAKDNQACQKFESESGKKLAKGYRY